MTTFGTHRAALAAGETTVEQLTSAYLGRASAHAATNAYLEVFPDALDQAREVDRRLANGSAGPLAGMVVAVKDVLCIKGRRMTCGSKILKDFTSPYDATVIERLKRADAILIGRTNLDEFAMGSSTEHSAFGRVHHPEDASLVPGGSSGGSAVAVATETCTAALGTDTGGSVRQPASFTGIVGLKPTYGRVSRYGLTAFASSFDCVGPMTRSVRDAADVLAAVSGKDAKDATTVEAPIDFFSRDLDANVRGLRIGLPGEYFSDGLQPGVRKVIDEGVEALRSAGASIIDVSLPHTAYTIATYYILVTAEASANLARYDGARYGFRASAGGSLNEMYVRARTEGFGEEVKRRLLLGTFVLSSGYYDAYYDKGQRVRRLIREDFVRAFESVDCIVTPTAPTTAFAAGVRSADPLSMYLSDVYTVSANLAGIPGVSVPSGKDDAGLPVGLQVLGKHFGERTILNVALAVEQNTNAITTKRT